MGRKSDRVGPDSPLYLQLREVIRGKVEGGEYPPGTAIPSESTLAETYGIHRLSVRSAVSSLIGEGLLKSVQGKGIFVVGEKQERDIEAEGGFRQTMLTREQETSAKVLVKTLRPAGVVLGRQLSCPPETELYYIKRLCHVGGEPVSMEEIYIPEPLVPKLKDVDLDVFPLSEVYEFYGIHVVRGEQSLEIETLEPIEARLMDIDPTLGVLVFRCVSYDQSGRAVEYARTYIRGDKCTFGVHYQK